MLYKTVKIDNWENISKVLYPHLPDEYKTSGGFRGHDPKIFEKCLPLVKAIETYTPWSNVNNIAVISSPPDKFWPIHTDWEITYPYSLNIPIFNCTRETYTSFYRIKDELNYQKKQSDINKIYVRDYLKENSLPEGHVFDIDDVEEIDRYYLTEPTLYNITVPHTVINTGTKIRISISIRFRDWVEFDA